jgi:hypothetical protein
MYQVRFQGTVAITAAWYRAPTGCDRDGYDHAKVVHGHNTSQVYAARYN